MNATPHAPDRSPGPTVSTVMRVGLHTVGPDDTVAHAARVMLDRGIHALPVVSEDGTAVGLLSLSDLVWQADRFTPTALREASGRGAEPPLARRRVRDLMTPDLFAVSPDAPLDDLLRFFAGRGLHRALVLDGGRLMGLVSLADLLHLIAEPPGAPPPAH